MIPEIILKNVNLDFPIYDRNSRSFRNSISNLGGRIASANLKKGKNAKQIVKGLRDINLTLNDGDKIALLGPNGSGKTTLLKTIAEIYRPTSGSIKSNGDISCMLDVGFGMEEDATGYENLIISNVIRGKRKNEIDEIIKEAADFSGLHDFLHMPLRTYSQGMAARLAFSSAISCTPDIFLIDEFFSTGDLDFSKKSKKKILELMDASSILVFASHDLNTLKTLCNKAICMKNGEISFTGNIEDACRHYEEFFD